MRHIADLPSGHSHACAPPINGPSPTWPPTPPSLYKYSILLLTLLSLFLVSLNPTMASSTITTFFSSLLLLQFLTGSYCATFTIINKCGYPVWPGILSNAGTPPLSTTGFLLQPGQSNAVTAPAGWSGRLWGRTLCSQDSTGKFSCITGDCGSSAVECGGGGAAPPATLAEFTLNGAGGMDFYDVSLVDGYNLPMTVEPEGGGNCTSTGCEVDLNGECPAELKVRYAANGPGGEEGVACKSACEAFGEAEYCCSGAYATPDTCKPSQYSELFKAACPRAYSYAYDDGTSTFTCASSPNYVLTFCAGGPTPSGGGEMKSGKEKYAEEAADVSGGDGGGSGWRVVVVMAAFGMLS